MDVCPTGIAGAPFTEPLHDTMTIPVTLGNQSLKRRNKADDIAVESKMSKSAPSALQVKGRPDDGNTILLS